MAHENPRVASIYAKADLVGPDSMPFVYWISLLSRRACAQFDASSIIEKLASRAREKGYRFFLYGGHPEVLRSMEKRLKELFPHLEIVGTFSPPFRPLTEAEDAAVCETINRLHPDILCVGLGTPKQDYWIDEHIERIPGTVMIPCGAIFDFFGGRIKRAPRLVSLLCLEWLYRLFGKDFKRLWKRYTLLNLLFLWNFFLQCTRLKRFPSVRMPRPEPVHDVL
jgi:N-acetylglucosaminyldiphosphoundecaprenol N-acetyl-beta-D-mannosaminyltransferase